MAASVARRGFQSPDSGTKAHAWDGVAGRRPSQLISHRRHIYEQPGRASQPFFWRFAVRTAASLVAWASPVPLAAEK